MTVTIETMRAAAKACQPTINAARVELTAKVKLRIARETYAPVVIDHLNPARAISVALTIAEIDALLKSK